MPEKVKFSASMLSAGFKRQVAGFKRPIASLAVTIAGMKQKAADLAPKVVKLFNQLRAEHGITQADFARLYDAKVPTTAAEYRVNPTYMAIDYLVRVERGANRPRAGQGRRDPATDSLARSLATIMQVVKDAGPIWVAVAKEFRLTDRAIKRLQTRVQAVKPIVDLSAIVKPITLGESKIVHMEPRNVTTSPAEEEAQPGRRVRRAA